MPYNMNIIHIQPALPAYRIDFFNRLAAHYGEDMCVYYSPVDMGVLTAQRDRTSWEKPIGPMRNPIRGLEWQVGALAVPFKRGDTVIVCGAPRNVSTLLLIAKARVKGARTIWWGQYWSATTNARRHRIRMWLTRFADALLFYTDDEVARFHADGWTHSGAVGALNNGLDFTEVRKLRHTYDPDTRAMNLLFIGRVTEKARLDLLIDALVEPQLANAHLHVLGDGFSENMLRSKAASLGVADRITWHGGTTNETRIAQLANRCAVFVYPGQVGLSLVHAMGYGLPCIVHDQPLHHMPEIAAFKKGETGATFREDDAVSLAVEVAKLLKHPLVRTAYSRNCLEETEIRFNTSHMAERFIEFVEQVAAESVGL